MDCGSLKCCRQIHFEKLPDIRGEGELILDIYQDGSTWICMSEFSGFPFVKKTKRAIYGGGSLQALILGLQFVKMIFQEAEQDNYSIWWLEPGDGAGIHL